MKLTLRQIHKKYGAHTVLRFESWEIEQGIHWLKGGNGVGKTTLFRIICGLTDSIGDVVLNNVSLKKHPQQFRSKISYAEAEPAYPTFITAAELLAFYKDIRNASQDEIDFLIDLFEMRPFLKQKIGGYSSGMLKKLSLICAFIGEVELYILDEPLITIDASSAEKLYRLISEKAKEGKSFLLSSHQEIDSSQFQIMSVLEISNAQIIQC